MAKTPDKEAAPMNLMQERVWAATYAVFFQAALQRAGGSRLNARALAREQADHAVKELEDY